MRELGARLVNVHFNDPDRPQEFASALVPLLERCAAVGVSLAVENVPATSPEAINRLFTLWPRGAPVGLFAD